MIGLLIPLKVHAAPFIHATHDHVFFSTGTTYYLVPGGITWGYSTEAPAQVPYRTNGTISQFWVYLIANSITATSTVTLRVNGADTGIIIPIASSTAGAFQDVVHSTYVHAGDLVDFKLVTGATGTNLELNGQVFLFSPDTNSMLRMTASGYGGSTGQTNGFADFYSSIANMMGNGSGFLNITSEPLTYYQMKAVGTFSHMAVYVTSNARGVSIPFTLRKNGSDTALAITVPAGQTGLFEDLTHTVSVVAGDTVTYSIGLSAGSDGNLISASYISTEFTTTNNTMEYPVTNPNKLFGAGAGSSVTTFQGPLGFDSVGPTYQLPSRITGTVSHLHFYTSTNTATTNTTITIRINHVNGNNTLTIPAGTTGYFEDQTDVDNIAPTDFVDYLFSSPGGTGSLGQSLMLGALVTNPPPNLPNQNDPLGVQFFPNIDENPSDYPSYILMTDSLYKVFQSSTAPGNLHYQIVHSMQNESQSFQVHVKPTMAISSLTVTVSDLVNAQTGTHISSSTTDIVVYREFYMSVTTPTALSTTTYMGGLRTVMPDQLIPAIDPYYHQTTNAFPVAVSSGNTQSAWIDVHVPTAAPSGYYQGTVTVSSGSVVISTMPVVYAVWAWVMPSTASLPTIGAGFGYNGFNNVAYGAGGGGTYPGAGGSADQANIYEWIDGTVQMLDNRWTVDSPNYIYPNSGSFTTYNNLIGPLLNGTTAFTSTILPGAALTKIELITSSFTASSQQNWATNFTNKGWFSRLFNYFCDEPAGGTWALCISSMTLARTYSTPPVPNQVTANMATSITKGATNYIDWMTPIIEDVEYPGTSNLRSTYNTWLSTNSFGVQRYVGSYQDCESAGTCSQGTIGPANTPTFPNRHIDGTPVANRAFESWMFLNNFSYELYFAIDSCDNTNAGYPCAGGGPDPWHQVYAFGGNGDGTLMYPSTATFVSVSTPIWVPSMRLKYFRDGEQDYEYENYLNTVGQGALVTTQIGSWMTNGYTFSNSPAGIEAARIAMGNAIHQLTYPLGSQASPTPPTAFTGKCTMSGKVKAQ